MELPKVTPIAELDRKAYAVDQLRDRLRPFDAVDTINEIQTIIRDEWRTMGKNQVDALKLQSDIQFRKLSKILPDLKAMDHSVGETASKVNFIINMSGTSAPSETVKIWKPKLKHSLTF